MLCKCGCGGDASWLISGKDFGGYEFVDEPACNSAAAYCEEAAYELDLAFSKKPILG